MTSDAAATDPTSESLVDALNKNREATEEVEQVVDDLAVVHAVLDSQVPQAAREEDLGLVIEQAAQLELRLSESVRKLERVNETLAEEIKARVDRGVDPG